MSAELDGLRAAWADMMAALDRARDAVDSPDLHAPPVTSLGVAEGYRYLMGFAFSAIERAFAEDPEFPYFRRAIQPIDKATIDNADALYLSAAIDGSRGYMIHGSLGPKAPQYLIFETHTVYAGDTGTLAELGPGGRVVTGMLDSSALLVDDDGGNWSELWIVARAGGEASAPRRARRGVPATRPLRRGHRRSALRARGRAARRNRRLGRCPPRAVERPRPADAAGRLVAQSRQLALVPRG